MLFENDYKTLVKNARAEYKDRGSIFYAYALKVENKKEFDTWLKKVKTKYPDATHHCWAYVLHPDKSESHSTDDGEPSNSAGKPILRAIQSLDLTQIAIIVVRYYGGVNLGVPGLIAAYGGSATLAIEKGKVKTVSISEVYEIKAHFGEENQWYQLINNSAIVVVEQEALPDGYKAIVRCKKEDSKAIQAFFGGLFNLEIKFLYFS